MARARGTWSTPRRPRKRPRGRPEAAAAERGVCGGTVPARTRPSGATTTTHTRAPVGVTSPVPTSCGQASLMVSRSNISGPVLHSVAVSAFHDGDHSVGNSCQIQPNLVKLGPDLAVPKYIDAVPMLGVSGQFSPLADSGQVLVEFGRSRANFGRSWAEFVRNCRRRTNISPIWPIPRHNDTWPRLGRCRPHFGQFHTWFGQIWVSSTGFVPTWANICLRSKELHNPNGTRLEQRRGPRLLDDSSMYAIAAFLLPTFEHLSSRYNLRFSRRNITSLELCEHRSVLVLERLQVRLKRGSPKSAGSLSSIMQLH